MRKGLTDPSFVEIKLIAANVTAHSDNTVAPSTSYTYKVRAVNNAGGSASNEATGTTPSNLPNAPSNLTATATSSSQVNLSWTDNSPNETNFKILRRGPADASFVEINTVAPNVITFADTTVAPSMTYIYKVRAINAFGGNASNEATVTTPNEPLPATPSNLVATALSSTQVNLSWFDNSTNEMGFKILRKGPFDTSFVEINLIAANSTTYSDITASASTTYTYKVRAVNNAGGAATNEATVTTPGETVPNAPSNLTGNAISSTRIDLSWIDNSTNETNFKILRKGPLDTSFVEIALVNVNVTTYADRTVTAGITYTYKVRAINSAGGGVSNEVSVRAGASPGPLGL